MADLSFDQEKNDLSAEAKAVPVVAGRADSNDREFVKGLGLTSSTMLVMGSMIGSGIFLVSAEIAREVNSPALLIGAWVVTGLMTIIAALSYGELAAMMPHAGGQYVYLREALGPVWGFLYGWTLFLVIQTGTIAAVGVAFGRFLGVFFPSISSTHWIIHIVKVPPIHIGAMVLGNMDVGLNTQNLMAVLMVVALSVMALSVFGIPASAAVSSTSDASGGASVDAAGVAASAKWKGPSPSSPPSPSPFNAGVVGSADSASSVAAPAASSVLRSAAHGRRKPRFCWLDIARRYLGAW